MREFTWTQTIAEAHLWGRALERHLEPGRTPTLATVAAQLRRGEPRPLELPVGVFPPGLTDLDLIEEILRTRPAETPLAELLAEPRREAEQETARLEFTDRGRIVEWDRDQPIIGLPAFVRRDGRLLATVGFRADCIQPQQGEWDELREGWPTRLADRGWQPCSTAFLRAAMTGFLDVYARRESPRMHDVMLVEPVSAHPRIITALRELHAA